MVATAVCIFRGLLPKNFPNIACDPAVIIETPRAPAGLSFLVECRYDWHSQKQSLLRSKGDGDLQRVKSDKLSEISDALLSSPVTSSEAIKSWIDDMETSVCPRIRVAIEKQKETMDMDKSYKMQTDQVGEGESSQCPPVYSRVLDLLRDADRSGKWPKTSKSRARVIDVEDPALGGTFSAGVPVQEGAICRGNDRFAELVEAAFELEKTLMPSRPPSTMVAINRRASFRPHTDAGAGYGQSTSLIVALGDFAGGELNVEGKVFDIRYNPLSFDGWRSRHWPMPFEGERYSLVFFTPAAQTDSNGGSRFL